MELNKENMKKIRWLIAFSVLLYLGVQNLDVVLKYVKIVWGLLLPFVLGGAMAFVLNVPMAFIERHVFGKAKEKEDRRGRAAAKFARPVSLIFSIVLVVLAILVVVLIVAPELGRTLVNVVKKVEEDIEKWGGQSGILHYYRDYGTGEHGYEFCNWFCVFLLCAPSEREAGQAGPESSLCDLTCENSGISGTCLYTGK